jgi:hypothetical protein
MNPDCAVSDADTFVQVVQIVQAVQNVLNGAARRLNEAQRLNVLNLV